MLFASFSLSIQAKRTTLSATIEGYERDMVYFDCAQTPLIRAEFHTNPGEDHIYSFETDQIVSIIINGSTTVILEPGDSLHTDIAYENRKVAMAQFSGTDQAVAANRLYWDVRELKRQMRYKSQLLGCAVLDVKPKARLDDSRMLLERFGKMLETVKSEVTPSAATYIQAEIEANVYNSFMEYPPMYAELRKVPIEEQGIGDYWNCMDQYQLRQDEVSLRCPDYISLLMRYLIFDKEKKAMENGTVYERADKFEDIYNELVTYYEGATRDMAVYMLIGNFIRGGKEIERVDPILQDYKTKYNLKKEYVTTIEALLL